MTCPTCPRPMGVLDAAAAASVGLMSVRILRAGAGSSLVETIGGRTAELPNSAIPTPIVRAHLVGAGRMAPPAPRANPFAELVDDMQAAGRDWVESRIRELNDLGVRWQSLATAAEGLQDAPTVAQCREHAAEVRHVLDDLYWILETYLGGIEDLPPAPRARIAPQVILGALGIITGAALVAYIASQVRTYSEFRLRIEAALDSGNADGFVGPPTPEPPGLVDQVTSGIGTLVKVAGVALLAYAFWPELKSGAKSYRERRAERVEAA